MNVEQLLAKIRESLADVTSGDEVLYTVEPLIREYAAQVGPASLLKAREERDELDRLFDLRWKADMRAIQRWRKESPRERALTWPDRADLGVWLLERFDKALEIAQEYERAENAGAFDDSAELWMQLIGLLEDGEIEDASETEPDGSGEGSED